MRVLEFKQGAARLARRRRKDLEPGEARIRVLLAGICSTDLQLRAGYMGFAGVPGHEFVGEVIESPGAPELCGRRVVGEINAGCGDCHQCRAGDSRHCADRTVLGILGRDGAFAEELSLPQRNLHLVSPDLPLERAVFAEPLAAAFEVLEQIDVVGRQVLVLGCGKLGSLVARVLHLRGADVQVMTRTPRSAMLLSRDGIPLADATQRVRYDIVVESTGTPAGFTQALGLVRPRGTIVLKSTCAGEQLLSLAPVVIDELTVVGSRCGPFAPALEVLEAGALRPEQTVSRVFALEEFDAALAAAERPGDPARRKVLLRP